MIRFYKENKSLILNVAKVLNYSVLNFGIFKVPYTIVTDSIIVFNVLAKHLKILLKSKFSPLIIKIAYQGFPGGSDSKESACNAGNPALIPGLGRSPGEGNGNPHQYSCLENPMDRGAWRAIVHGIAKSQTGLSK